MREESALVQLFPRSPIRWDFRHPLQELPCLGSNRFSTDVPAVRRRRRCYWRRIFTKSSESLTSNQAIAMGAADEVPQGEGVQISYTHARQTRVSLYERVRYTPAFSSCSWNVDDDVYSTRAEKLESFIEMWFVTFHFLDDCSISNFSNDFNFIHLQNIKIKLCYNMLYKLFNFFRIQTNPHQ